MKKHQPTPQQIAELERANKENALGIGGCAIVACLIVLWILSWAFNIPNQAEHWEVGTKIYRQWRGEEEYIGVVVESGSDTVVIQRPDGTKETEVRKEAATYYYDR